jgi:hypothetical protein
MKKINVEIVFEETSTTTTINLLEDIMEALQKFKVENAAWSEIYSITIDGLSCSNSNNGMLIKHKEDDAYSNS